MADGQTSSDLPGELDAPARLRISVAGLGVALAVATLLALAGPTLRQPLFDLYQTLTPAPAVSRRVHVVVIDADSLRNVGGWPWSRFYLARLVEQISNRGAAVIASTSCWKSPTARIPLCSPASTQSSRPRRRPTYAGSLRWTPCSPASSAAAPWSWRGPG